MVLKWRALLWADCGTLRPQCGNGGQHNYSGGVAKSAAFEKSVNFAKVADSMGCVGFRVEKATDINSALDQALACGRPAIVEITCDAAIRAKRG